MSRKFPKSIVCMTEESVEVLYALGLSDLIVGVSCYVKRPEKAKSKPTISTFTSANLKKIIDLRPDLILGFSDIQKDIAKDLIGAGLNVFITNQRSLNEILDYIMMLGNLVGAGDETRQYIIDLENKIKWARDYSAKFKVKPKVYIEEWDNPQICGIEWFSEIVELCGGEVVHKDKSQSSMATDRIISVSDVASANPDIILACWCGKKVQMGTILERKGFENINAIKNNAIFELEPEIFLQPGPAPIVDGIDILLEIFEKFQP
jgi:iron complex transport system substrate-binding protein